MRTPVRLRTAPLRRFGFIAGIVAIGIVAAGAAPAGAATSGTRLWTKTYDGPASGFDAAADIAINPSGTALFVTGGSTGTTNGKDFLTRAYDPSTGAVLWTNRYDGPAHFDDDAISDAVSPDGTTVFVTGESSATTDPDNYDFVTMALDAATGAQLWLRRYDGPSHSNDAPFALTVSPDGQAVYVTGTSLSFTTSFDIETFAYDANTGATLWKKRYDGPSSGVDEAYDVAVQPDGSRVFVTGQSGSANNFDMETIAYDAGTGATIWKKRVDGPAHGLDYATALTIDAAGSRLFVTGTTTGQYRDYTTIAYDPATGADLWTERFAGSGGGDDVAETIAVSPDGSRVVVGGFLQFIAYDAVTGAEEWNKSLTGVNEARSIRMTPDGSTVVATGAHFLSTPGTTLGIVALEAPTGARVWGRHVDQSVAGNDLGASVVLSPDGATAFATGRIDQTGTGTDYVTVAYAV